MAQKGLRGPQRPPTAPQLRLALSRVLGEPETFPTNPHNFALSPDAQNDWFARKKHDINWRIQEKKAHESKRARLNHPNEATQNTAPSASSTPEPAELEVQVDAQVPKKKKGRPVAFEWTEKWTCDHSGSYRDQRKDNLSPSKRRIHRTHESIKVGCKAYIWFRKRPGKSEIEIEYGWQHTGHTPLSLKDMRDSMMTDRVRDWVNSRVDEGLDWRAMKDLLRIDEDILDELEKNNGEGTIPESLRVAQKDVYNAIRRRLAGIAHLDPDGQKSLKLWKARLEKKGYSVLYEPVSAQTSTENSYVFAIVSPWQKKLLAKYQKIACLDSTHNTCFSATGKEEKAYLYTVVVKNLATGKGSPVAFMITPSEAQYAIMDFLRWLKAMGFIPNCWMIDCSDTEIAGIRSAYGVDVLVFECLWHVLKAITEQAKKKLNVGAVPLGATKVEANKQLRASAKADFTRLIHAATSDDFEEVWQEIEVAYAEYTAWMAYLRTEWMGKKERWALAWRKDTPHYRIETNNYVESWHHHLKYFYLRLMRKQRVDVMLHILTEKIEPDFRRAELRVTLNFELPTFSKVELTARKKAYAIDSADAEGMLQYNEESLDGRTPDLLVQSFTDPEGWYLVCVKDSPDGGPDNTAIFSCECPDHTYNELTCKHMFIASRISSYPIRRFNSTTITTATSSRMPDPNAEANNVLQEKFATRDSILDEITTINSLATQLRGLSLDPNPSRARLVDLAVQVTRTRRELSEVVNQRSLYATQVA